MSVSTGEIPSLWRQANVVPIFKKGVRSDMSNYRPISLTSVIGKMLESIIAKRIWLHLESHNLISDSQHGFTKVSHVSLIFCPFIEKCTKRPITTLTMISYILISAKRLIECHIKDY